MFTKESYEAGTQRSQLGIRCVDNIEGDHCDCREVYTDVRNQILSWRPDQWILY